MKKAIEAADDSPIRLLPARRIGADGPTASPAATADLPRGPDSTAGGYPPQWAATAEQRLRALWRTSLDGLLVVDDQRRYISVNRPAAELLGARVERVLGSRIDDFTAREDWSLLKSLWSEFRQEGSQQGAYQVLRGDGSRTMVEYRATWDFGPGQHLIVAREIAGSRTALSAVGRRRLVVSDRLTPREREVLQLAADGRSPREIADALYLSPHTVRSHLQNIHEKLGVRDRASAVAVALRLGLIE